MLTRFRAYGGSNTIRIAFGSCLDQNDKQPIWRAIARKNPDVFIFLGDNVYADTEDMEVMAQAYAALGANRHFAAFRAQFPIAATWDDHDYGCNEAGAQYPRRQESKDLMLDFFGEPPNSRRRRREGVYTSFFLGSGISRVQVILLDLRWFRADSMLGPQQWRWLERELKRPAAHRVIASSVQFLSSEHRWEKWANFPREQERLLKLIDQAGARTVSIISGDMHFGEISKLDLASGSLYDITSSGLNRYEPAGDIFNSRRLNLFDQGENFGLLTISADDAEYEVCDVLGRTRIYRRVRLSAGA